jgi:hypothetical protein
MVEGLERPQPIEGDNLIIIADTLLNKRKKRLEMKVEKCARG